MPDYWSVPLNNAGIDDLDSTIAKGPDLSFIGNLANSYFQGKDQAYTQANRDVFKQGLPKDANGNIDWNQVSEQLARTGGAAQTPNLVSLQNTAIARQAVNQLGNSDVFSPVGSTTGTQSQPGTASVPPSSANAVPSQPVQLPQPNGPTGAPPSPPGQNLTQPNETGFSVSRGPVQSGPLPAPGQQQVAQFQPQQAAPPSGNMTEATAQLYDKRAADAARAATAIAAVNPAQSQALRALSDQWAKQSQIIRETLGKNAQTTNTYKDVISGAAAADANIKTQAAATTKLNETNITAGQKEYEGIQAQSAQYQRDLKPYLDVSKSIVNDPRAYTGIGGQLSLDLNRVKAALGDKSAAMLQEALQKVTASSVLGQINNQRAQLQEAGGASSRIFRQQVDLVEKAAPSIANTLAGNRFLIEVSSRMGNLATKVADMARDYKQAHGYLDAGFDQQLSNYMTKNPVFNQQEMTHPEILGAPTVPPQYAGNKQNVLRWSQAMGLNSGDPIRFPSGVVKAVP